MAKQALRELPAEDEQVFFGADLLCPADPVVIIMQVIAAAVVRIIFSGNIVDYSTSYEGVTASQLAAQTRLTISVQIKFVNKTDEKQNYDKRFSAYRDFDATESLSNVEDVLIKELSEEIIESIFMESVANW